MPNEKDFVKLIREHQAILFKISSVYTDNRDDHKDLYQDIVYQLWKSFDSFKGESKVSTWLYRVAMNTALTGVRSKKRDGIKVPIEKVVLQQTQCYDPERERQVQLLYQCIQRLNVLEKGLILLLLEGKKYGEIAEITGLSPTNVGTRISRIKKKLKSQVNETH